MSDQRVNVLASVGLAAGGVFGMVGTFTASPSLRGLAWGIETSARSGGRPHRGRKIILDTMAKEPGDRMISRRAVLHGLSLALRLTGLPGASAQEAGWTCRLGPLFDLRGYNLRPARFVDVAVEMVNAKMDRVANLKTAKALGLTVPPSELARADRVIE